MDLVTALLLCSLQGSGRHRMHCPHAALARESVVAAQSHGTTPASQNCIALVAGTSTSLDSLNRWQSFISEASRRFAIPEAWIRAVMRAESDGRTTLRGAPITSRAGAMGLMQVMPDTYAEMRRRYGLGSDPYDPHDNILAGTAYLRQMFEQFGCPQLLAAYNAGPERQRSIALITFNWSRLTCPRLASRQAGPRKISATSRTG